MVRSIAAIAAGLVAWFVIATLGNFLLRAAMPGYAAVEVALDFTLGMQVARLALGIVSSLGAGFVAAWISTRPRRDVAILIALLLVLFLPVHYSLWPRFPVWYHAAFLLSLVILPTLGASLRAIVAGTRRVSSV
jgi:hypothetical protein